MFQRLVAMLLCTCLLAGNVPSTAYTMAMSEGRMTEAVVENTEETDVEVAEEATETAEVTTEGSTEESGEKPETNEESTEESGETQETVVESTEESSETQETVVESTEESSETQETTEESTEESEETSEEATEEFETGTEMVAEAELQEEDEDTDDRMLTVEIAPEYRAADANITLTGEDACDRETTVVLYFREKGEDTWTFCNRMWLNQPSQHTIRMYRYDGESLKEETTYEYIVGIEEKYYDDIENLSKTVSGEFTTTKNELALCDTKVSAGYNDFLLETGYTGNVYKERKYIVLFYREKGAETWEQAYRYSWDINYQVSFRIGDDEEALKQGTEYEYAVILVMGDTDTPDSPDGEMREGWKKTGTFTTKQGSYELEITPDEKNSTFDKEALTISVKGTVEEEKLYVRLALKNSSIKHKVTLCKSKNYTETLKINNLTGNRTYTISGAELYMIRENKEIILETFTPDVTFTTKEIVPAEKINLSKNKIYLNAAMENSATFLYATTAPENACKKIYWSSSDSSVADYYYVYETYPVCVKIKAKGVGNAVIKARAEGTDKVIATCEVIVGSYIIGQKTESGYEKVDTLTLLKGESLENLVLLQKDGEELTPVEDYEVEIIRGNVAKWEDGKLTGTATGTTTVAFIKDGVESFFTLEVTEEPKNFRITGLATENEKYPAITREDGAYEIACKEGLTYQVMGQFDSEDSFEKSAFDWASSDETVAVVEAGVITPKKAGEVTIVATHNGNAGKKEIRLVIKEAAQVKDNTVYGLTNLKKKMCLKDLDLASVAGEGWEWKNPNTALYTLPINDGTYSFEAVYTGTDKYACVEQINVCIGTVTKLVVAELEKNHNHILQTNGDEMYLQIIPEYTGTISAEYSSYIPTVNGLNISWDEANNRYVITASKEGKYVLKPEIRVKVDGEEKTILTGKYEIKAVKDAQVYSIKVTTDTEGVTVDKKSGKIKLDFSEEIKKQSINLNAVVTDKDGNEIETALEWKIADKTVAGIKYNKKSSHQAALTVKGTGGDTILTVKAKDAAGYTVQIPLEIRDIRPRVDKTQVTVNMAYDFDDTYGELLSDDSGNLIEIVSAYDNDILDTEVYENDKKTVSTQFRLKYTWGETTMRIQPVNENVKPGTYKCQIGIRTEQGDGLFYYPITIKVINKMPTVKVSMDKLNLFYITEEADINFKISGGNLGIEKVTWEDNSEEKGNGFEILNYEWYVGVAPGGYKSHYVQAVVSQEHVDVKNGKPVDKGVTKGTLYVKLYGYRELVEIKNFKINYTYKKPKLESKNAVSFVAPEAGVNTGYFKVYDPLKKNNLYWYKTSYENRFEEAVCDNKNVTISDGFTRIKYQYEGNGNKKQETITCKLNSTMWREPLEVKHTIKLVNAEVKLECNTLVLNKAYKNKANVEISAVKELENLQITDLGIKGADKKAQKLIDDKVLNFNTEINQFFGNVEELSVQMNVQGEQKESVKNGTYTFYVTPYYYNKYTGERTATKSLKLKVTITDKQPSVTVNQKNTLNLLFSGDNTNVRQWITLKTDFKNVCQDFTVESARLTGDFSENFVLSRYEGIGEKAADNYYRLSIAKTGKIKAGQSYKLTIEYTLQTAGGDLITVADDFTVKTVQKLPKMTVKDKNEVLYACSDVGKTCKVEMSDTSYMVESISGGLDCNKDGEVDIAVSLDYVNDYYGHFGVYLEIVNPGAVAATTKGKTYKVPVTVKLLGRDGISKDATVNINVTVKK